jgi:hypothetical protein
MLLTISLTVTTTAQESLGDSTISLPAAMDDRTDTCAVAHGAVFSPRQLLVPTALIAAGAFGVSNGWFCSLKQDVRQDIQRLSDNSRCRLDETLRFLPAAAQVGLGLTGVPARHSLRERMMTTATAFAAMGVLVKATKLAVDEQRPATDGRDAFPSGHTATAFMGAELVRQEYGNAWGAGAYAVATGVAFLRLYNDRHWLNDVIGGAGVGLLSARIAYWLLPWERRLLGWDSPSAAMAVVPAYDAGSHAPTLCLTVCF